MLGNVQALPQKPGTEATSHLGGEPTFGRSTVRTVTGQPVGGQLLRRSAAPRGRKVVCRSRPRVYADFFRYVDVETPLSVIRPN